MKNSNKQFKVATLGGGCFWCTEGVFEIQPGVVDVISGYAGGSTENPTYEQVCSGKTGHAEVVQLVFDPEIISYEQLLRLFFKYHDPTTLNRQGADVGTQYRSIILYADEAQKKTAEKLIKELTDEKAYATPIVTEVKKLDTFWKAEAYHQDYFRKHPEAGYCQAVIRPKVDKAKKDLGK